MKNPYEMPLQTRPKVPPIEVKTIRHQKMLSSFSNQSSQREESQTTNTSIDTMTLQVMFNADDPLQTQSSRDERDSQPSTYRDTDPLLMYETYENNNRHHHHYYADELVDI
jgi:hypothetical protein